MARIRYDNILGKFNPTTTYMPVRASSRFNDSNLQCISGVTRTMFEGSQFGILVDNTGQRAAIGDTGGITSDQLLFQVDNNLREFQLSGLSITSASAGTPAGLYLKIKVNGTNYKLLLLNN